MIQKMHKALDGHIAISRVPENPYAEALANLMPWEIENQERYKSIRTMRIMTDKMPFKSDDCEHAMRMYRSDGTEKYHCLEYDRRNGLNGSCSIDAMDCPGPDKCPYFVGSNISELEIMKITEKEIEMLNKIINTAINCGGDPGGPYFDEIGELQMRLAVNTWLKDKGLENTYHLVKQPLEPGSTTWYKIMRRDSK